MIAGLPSNWMSDDFELPKEAPCIISTLCEIKEGLTLEAATMKEYSWRPVIKSFFEKGVRVTVIIESTTNIFVN